MDKDFLYNSLPEIYRTLDVDQKLILKRFLEAIQEGGAEPMLDAIVEFANINNIDKLDEEQLRLLGRTFGYEYNENLSLFNQRRLIKNLIVIYKRKGTNSSVIYVTREITEFDAEIVPLMNKMFKTWSNKNHMEIPGYELSKTFTSFGDTQSHYLPGTKYSKTNIFLKLIPLFDIGLQFERSLALSEILQMLLPVYTKAFLLLSSNEGDEALDVKVDESKDRLSIYQEETDYTINADIEYLNINIDIIASIEENSNNKHIEDSEVTAIRFSPDQYDVSTQNFNDDFEHFRFGELGESVTSNLEESDDISSIQFKTEDETKNSINSTTTETNEDTHIKFSELIEDEYTTNKQEDGDFIFINSLDSEDLSSISSLTSESDNMIISSDDIEVSNTLAEHDGIDMVRNNNEIMVLFSEANPIKITRIEGSSRQDTVIYDPATQVPIVSASHFNIISSDGDTLSDSVNVPIDLRSMPNGTKDTYDIVNGTGIKAKRINTILFDGSADENWIKAQIGTGSRWRFYISIADKKINAAADSILCDRLRPAAFNLASPPTSPSISGHNTVSTINIFGTMFDSMSLTDFRSYISLYPLLVQYETLTTTTEIVGDLIVSGYADATYLSTDSDPEVKFYIRYQ
ncbi:MAG: hypothetical protein K0Q47_152 [Sedimentibacter sp.]|jgi:hypothetical protein|nr:hypothetical protein [Sedimentibacter sp.]